VGRTLVTRYSPLKLCGAVLRCLSLQVLCVVSCLACTSCSMSSCSLGRQLLWLTSALRVWRIPLGEEGGGVGGGGQASIEGGWSR
jgi:hypothetical protein